MQRRHPSVRALVIVSAAASMLVLASTPANAHEHLPFGDSYEITVGWATEPPFVDMPNAVWIRVDQMLTSGDMVNGDTFSFTFTEPGEYLYHCHHHAQSQQGKITVADSHAHEAATHEVTIGDDGTGAGSFFSPAQLAINAGDTVVWTHRGNLTHTVSYGEGGADHGSGSDGHEHEAPMSPVSGLGGDIRVEVSTGGKSVTLDFRGAFGQPGVYIADITPTVAGVYNVRIFGTIGATTSEISADLQEVQAAAAIAFPEKPASQFELAEQLSQSEQLQATLQGRVNDLEGQRDLMLGVSIVAVVVAAISLIVAGTALSKAGRARVRRPDQGGPPGGPSGPQQPRTEDVPRGLRGSQRRP